VNVLIWGNSETSPELRHEVPLSIGDPFLYLEAVRDAVAMLRGAEIRDGELWQSGERLTSEAVRARIREVCARAGAPAPPDIMVKPMGPDPRIGHYPGAGTLPADTPILIDPWPRDEESGCWADMTRTTAAVPLDLAV
jgi:hypothetical protein